MRLAGRRAQPPRQVARGGLVWPGPIPVHHWAPAGTPPSTSSTDLFHQTDLMYSADRGVNASSCPGVRVLGCPSAAMAAADRARGQRLPGPGIGDAGGRAAQPGLLPGGARPASGCCSCAPATAPAHRPARPCHATATAPRSRWPVPTAGPSPAFISMPYGCCATSSASTSPASPPALGHGDRRLPRLPAHRGRHRHPHQVPAARPHRHPPLKEIQP